MRDLHSLAEQKDPDLDHPQTSFTHPLIWASSPSSRPPALTVPVRPAGPHRLINLADQLIGQLAATVMLMYCVSASLGSSEQA
jgi:hypothetical protein